MNLNETIELLRRDLRDNDHNETIISILKDFVNSESHTEDNRKPNSIEERLKNFRIKLGKNGGDFNMNLFPSDHYGACQSFCLAIASKKFDKPRKGLESGFKGLMLEMIAYWFSCIRINKQTLILTSCWDDEIFEENYKKIIDQYVQAQNKSVIIIEVGQSRLHIRYPY